MSWRLSVTVVMWTSISGLKEMVNSVRSLLKEKGVDRKRIVYERYD
jgi:hypothetical protein